MRRLFLISQPNFPVPAIKDGAIANIIQDTLDCLTDQPVRCVSIWDESFRASQVDKHRFIFFDRKAIFWRLFRKFLLQIPFYRQLLDGLSLNEQGILVAIKWGQWVNRPGAVVVHTSKPGWAIKVKQFCGQATRVFGYYHNSEAHLSPEPLMAELVRNLDGHIFVSEYAARSFMETASRLTGRNDLNIHTVKNGVNPCIYAEPSGGQRIRQKLSIGPEKVVLLFAGRLIPRKGLHCLLQTLQELDEDVLENMLLIVAGSHDYYNDSPTEYISKIRAAADDPRLSGQVVFLGYIPHQEMPSYYLASDIFVLPSIEDEGMPLSLIEAQMASLPVIASSVGGASETLLPDVTGFLIDPPGDPERIATHLARLVMDEGLRKQMGAAARKFAIENFSRERMASDFWKIIETMNV